MSTKDQSTPAADIATRIYFIRDQKVMIDSDLADLSGVETKHLVRQVKRNRDRFPADFMFVVDNKELALVRCQIGTSNNRGGRRYQTYAFTEQGVAMLCWALGSPLTGCHLATRPAVFFMPAKTQTSPST